MFRSINPLLQAAAIMLLFAGGAGAGYTFQKSLLESRQSRINEQAGFIVEQQKAAAVQRDLLKHQDIEIRYLIDIVEKQTKAGKGLNEIQYTLNKKKPSVVVAHPVVQKIMQKTIVQKTVIIPPAKTVTRTVIKLVPAVTPFPGPVKGKPPIDPEL